MSLAAGTRLGAYEILSTLGAGGMGEVYRARDTKLNRDVALKILPAEFALDAERLARFKREAQVLASLDHPNIGAIYGLEGQDGLDGEPLALVLQLVEGPTLADRITEGPIPTDEALPIARQIADALRTAHDQGIIHRDLKPANIKVSSEGTVKVLDFGLAKMLDPGGVGTAGQAGTDVAQGFSPAMTHSPTITTPAMTMAGVILGTAAYMSPEQAKGRPADKRSDIWAFGCVLFEMLTGRRAFDGEDVSDTLASVLKGQPDWEALPSELPSIRALIEGCLEKDRKQRVGDVSTLLFVMRQPPVASHIDAKSPIPIPRQPLWRRASPFAVTAMLAAGLVAIAAWTLRPLQTPPVIARFPLMLPEGQRLSATILKSVALSPDGTRIAYAANQRLYLRSFADQEARPIPGSESAAAVGDPEFSPDGKFIAFHETGGGVGDGLLKRIAVAGGPAVTLARVSVPFGLAWSADGIVIGQSGKGILRVSPDGGQPELLVSVTSDEIASAPQLLPDRKTLLFTVATGTARDRWDKAQVFVQSLRSGTREKVLEGASDARFLATGHIVYASGGVLFAIPFDVRRLKVTGGAVPMVEGVRRTSGTLGYEWGAQFSTSSDGSLIYIPGPSGLNASAQLDLQLSDRQGTTQPLKLAPRAYQTPRVSPDGKQVVFGIDDGKTADIWIYELSGASSPRRLTFGGRNRYPVWSGDGRRIAFQSDRDGDKGIFWQRADVSGTAERLTKADADSSHVPEAWSPKGDIMLFTVTKGTSVSLSMFFLQDKKVTTFGGIRSFSPIGAVFSPDGRWVAYSAQEESQRHFIYVQPFPPTGQIAQISTEGDDGHHPVWAPDGKELFFVGPSRFVSIGVATQPNLMFGNPARLPRAFTEGTGPFEERNYDISPDGNRFIGIIQAPGQAQAPGLAAPQIQVVLNWFTELKQRVPTK